MKTARTLGERVKERRTALGLSQPQLAKRVGGISYQAIQQLEQGGGSKHLVSIARALGVTAEWLQDGHGPAPAKPAAPSRAAAAERLKVLGMAECGPDGWSLWNGDVIDMIERPASLNGVAQAYAVYIVGVSMEPRYHPGEVVHVHPGKPVNVGAYVLVQRRAKGGDTPLAVIKRVVKRTATKITLEQFNPHKVFDIKAADIVSVHRVVGSGET